MRRRKRRRKRRGVDGGVCVGGGGVGGDAGGRERDWNARDIITHRIVNCICNNSTIIISAAAAAAAVRFFLNFTRAQDRPRSSIHAFHAEDQVGQQRVRRRLRVDRCGRLWRFSCGLLRVGCAHENGRNQQSEGTVACEIFFSSVSVSFFAVFPVSSLLNRIVSQHSNSIGADGARAIADAMRTNSSVKELYLVSWFCY